MEQKGLISGAYIAVVYPFAALLEFVKVIILYPVVVFAALFDFSTP